MLLRVCLNFEKPTGFIAKPIILVEDTLKAFDDFKNKQQKCLKQCFLICKSIYVLKAYIFLFNTLYIEIKPKC